MSTLTPVKDGVWYVLIFPGQASTQPDELIPCTSEAYARGYADHVVQIGEAQRAEVVQVKWQANASEDSQKSEAAASVRSTDSGR